MTTQIGQAEHQLDIQPMDEHNTKLVANVHPPSWANPQPAPMYNLVAIGGGTAGLVSAAIAASVGAKVALIERNLLGGDCLNVGCVPSKAVIRSGRAAADVRDAGRFGVRVPDGVEVDFGAAMERMREVRARISPNDSAARFRDLGVDVFLGQASFKDAHTIQVGDQTLRCKKAVIATGARAVELPIPGLAEAGFLNNETVFNLTERPKRLAVLGGGPIGCELAQTFRRLGCEVFQVERAGHILIREDADAAEIVQNAFRSDGVELYLNSTAERVETNGAEKILHVSVDGKMETLTVDQVLVGVGRAPNVEGLNLEAAGVKYGRHGVEVNDFLQTTAPNIYAAGDISMRWKFTHAADFAAQIVIQNALFPGPKRKLSSLIMPWCTYTDPEIAHVGLYEKDAEEQGVELDTYYQPMADVDRAIAEGEDEGFVKIHCRRGTDKILGATIVARHAGELISEISVAMRGGLGLATIVDTIHPYPTQAEAIRKAGFGYKRKSFKPWQKTMLSKWLQWTR
jgi:pyruvate/2-oxoglutarate dehydrogenase complex dihydrolipoamide dehydrogenase (E3) component